MFVHIAILLVTPDHVADSRDVFVFIRRLVFPLLAMRTVPVGCGSASAIVLLPRKLQIASNKLSPGTLSIDCGTLVKAPALHILVNAPLNLQKAPDQFGLCRRGRCRILRN